MNSAYSQEFRNQQSNPNANFYDIQAEAESYFEQNGTGRGTGYKQYKRWEYWAEKRSYPSGDLTNLNNGSYYREYKNWKANYQPTHRAPLSNWECEGQEVLNYTGSWNPGVGRINAIAELPGDPNTLFICAPAGGVWKSTNGGSTWNVKTDNTGLVGTSCISFDASNSNIVYVGSGDRDASDSPGYGVWKSTDAGETWYQSGLTYNQSGGRVYEVKAHPTQANVVYAACSWGFYKSTNGGDSWTQLRSERCQDFEFKPNNPDVIYLVNDENIFKSSNGGSSFTEITSGVPSNSARTLIEVTPANPDYVYLLWADGSLFGGVSRSTNSGASFSSVSTQSSVGNLFGYSTYADDQDGQAWYDMALAVSPSDANMVFVSGILVWKSTNGGSSFTSTTEWVYPNNRGYTHADIHYTGFFGNNFYVGSDGGIYKSSNNGSDYTDLSEGVTIKQYYKIDVNKSASPVFIGGAQDNGTSIKSNEWKDWLGADGMDCAIDHSNNNIVYGSVQNGSFYKSTNGGENTVNINGNLNGPWVTPLCMDPNNSSVLYAGTTQLQKTTNGMGSWSQVSNFSGNENISEIAVAPSNSNYVFVARGASVYKSTNAGSSWASISSGLPNLYATYIAIHPNDPNYIVVTFSGSTAGSKVYRSIDGGSNWTNISGNLPNLSANSIVILENNENSLYVAMDYGIYYTDDNESQWEEFSTNLPLTQITELKVHGPTSSLYAGTYGRGLWRSDLNAAPQFTLDGGVGVLNSGNICGGDFIPQIQLTNNGTEDLISCELEYSIDGNDYNYSWTGSLASGESEVISLDPITLNNGYQTFESNIISVNGNSTDGDSGNNSSNVSFYYMSSATQFTVDIQPDNYAEDISWTLVYLETGATIASGGGYTNGDTAPIISTHDLDPGCYELTVLDSYGDGLCCQYGEGDIEVTNNCGEQLAVSNGEYTDSEVLEFCVDFPTTIEENDLMVSIQPNPFNSEFMISVNEVIEEVEVFDLQGRLIKSISNVNQGSILVDNTQLINGVYFVKIKSNNGLIKLIRVVKE